MLNMSCYVCRYSEVEKKTGYLMCKKHFFAKYVQSCSMCELFEHEICQTKEAYVDQEEEVEVEITVVDSDHSLTHGQRMG